MEDVRDFTIDLSNVDNIDIKTESINPELDREDKKVHVNGKRNANILFGYNKQGIQLNDDLYFQVDEVKDAVKDALASVGENEIVTYKKSGKLARNCDVIREIMNEARKDSQMLISEGTENIDAFNKTVSVKGEGRDDFIRKGNFILGKEMTLEDGIYITSSAIQKALEKFIVKKVAEPVDTEEEKVQDMLDKYYGNPKKEKEYKMRLKRFKSHIISIDGYKKVEDYPEKAEDEKFLQLEEFSYKLECLTRMANGDDSEYRYLLSVYKEMGAFNHLPKKEDGTEYTDEELINYLMYLDEMYIKTNNSAYNQHLNTQENLKTLGKYGEKMKYFQLKPIRNENGKIELKQIAGNIAKGAFNIFLFGRNNISAPIHKIVGTYIAAPIHKLLFDSEKHAAGLYKNKRTHRYEARKDYFEQMLLEEESQKEEKTGKFKFALKLIFGTRFKAIFNYKEGNIAVLSAGANDIADSFNNREVLRVQKEKLDYKLKVEAESIKQKIGALQRKIAKEQDQDVIKEMEEKIKKYEERLEEISYILKRPLPGIIQTDAVSLDQHDRANNENITKTVAITKIVVNILLAKLLSNYLYKTILQRTKTKKYIPGYYDKQTITVNGNIDKESLENLTIQDLLDNADGTSVDYHALGGNSVSRPDIDIARGMAIEHNGNVISSSDGIGFDILGRTNTIVPIDNDSKVFEIMAETMSKTLGKNITADDLINQVLNANNPETELESIINSLDIWTSIKDSGIPTGWLDADGSNIVDMLLSDKTVDILKYIPGGYKTLYATKLVTVVDKKTAAALAGLGVSTVGDLFELTRRTKTKEEREKEGTLTEKVKPFQRKTKKSYAERDLSNRWGFDGTKKGDYASLYDEDYDTDDESDIDDDYDEDGKGMRR